MNYNKYKCIIKELKKCKHTLVQTNFNLLVIFQNMNTRMLTGNKSELDFSMLSIEHRIMLSSYLTLLSRNDNKQEKLDLYEIIFNFNKNKRNIKTSYHDKFIKDLSEFLKSNPEYFSFIKHNFDKIKDNKTVIYRQQINQTEMDLIYSLKCQKNYHSLMNILYIVGVAKQNIVTKFLNKIKLNRFYPTSKILSEQRVHDIFAKLNELSAVPISYKINKDAVYFGNGFKVEEDEKYFTDEKKEYFNQLEEEEIFKSLSVINADEEIQKTKVVCEPSADNIIKETEKETILEEETVEDIPEVEIETLDNILDLGEDKHFSFDIFKKLYEYEQDNYQHCRKEYNKIRERLNEKENDKEDDKEDVNPHTCKADIALRKILEVYELNINDYLSKYENLAKVYNGKNLGDNWKEIKDNARLEFNAVKTGISRELDKLFDVNVSAYKYAVYHLATINKKFVTLTI